MPYNKLLLVHSSVKDIDVFINSSLPNVKVVIVKSTDLPDTVSDHIEEFDDLTHIAVVFPNYNNRVPLFRTVKDELLRRHHTVEDIMEINSFFSKEFIQFIKTLKSEASSLEYLDIISCNIKKNNQFDELYEEGIKVRYSTNLTGMGGDWILESDNINVTPLYFTDTVRSYKYTLDAPQQSCSLGMVDLGTLGGATSIANGCSADGSIVVGYSNTVGGPSAAFKYENGVMTDLGTLGGNFSIATGCSADGSIIVGVSLLALGDAHAFKYENGVMTDLGTLGGIFSYAYGCSADGSIVVGYSDTVGGPPHAFKYENGVMTDLGTLGGGTSIAYGCSADGSIIIGYSSTVGGEQHAFKYENGIMTDLGTLGGVVSTAYGCSADGSIIVGYSNTVGGPPHAFKYQSACPSSSSIMNIMQPPITFVTPPVNPQTGDYDSSRLTNSKADKVIRVYTNFNRSNAMPVFPDYATYMRYLNGALRF